MVDLQALGGCEPAVCAEGHHCRGSSDLVADTGLGISFVLPQP